MGNLATLLSFLSATVRANESLAPDSTCDGEKRRSGGPATTIRHMCKILTGWATVPLSRHPERPLATDYLRMVFRNSCELHGDCAPGDERAIITGFARLGAHRVMFIGQNKGKKTREGFLEERADTMKDVAGRARRSHAFQFQAPNNFAREVMAMLV